MKEEPTKQGIRPMMCTPGYTAKRFTELPIGSESEMSVGPDHINPYRSERERRATEEILRAREERREQETREGDAFLETVPSERGRGAQTLGPLDDAPGFWNTDVSHDIPTHDIPKLEFDVLDSVQAFDPFESGDGF